MSDDIQMVFELFDTDGGGTLGSGEDIGNAMRAAGVAPTDEEIQVRL